MHGADKHLSYLVVGVGASSVDSHADTDVQADRATFKSDVGTEASDEEEVTQTRKRKLVCFLAFVNVVILGVVCVPVL